MSRYHGFPEHQLEHCDLTEDGFCPLCGEFHSCCCCAGYFQREVKRLIQVNKLLHKRIDKLTEEKKEDE